jgi:hypothetical protein
VRDLSPGARLLRRGGRALRCRGARGLRSLRTEPRDRRAHRRGLARLHDDADEHAGLERLDVEGGLLGLDLGDDVARLQLVAFLESFGILIGVAIARAPVRRGT